MRPERARVAVAVPAAERWLARLALVAVAAAAAVLLAAGVLRSITALLIGAACVAVGCAAAWWVVARRGPVRWLAVILLVAAPGGLIALYVLAGLLWEVLLSLALTAGAAVSGRAALRAGRQASRGPDPPQSPAVPARHPYLIMNPRSGGGKVTRLGLAAGARDRGAEVALLEGPGHVDVAALARRAADRGADLLGVAGGDGTQALVAGVAAACGVPMVVIAAGTRNHFALDLGLDRDDPAAGLAALAADAVEIRIDLGQIGGRTFVNNASFGAYAQVVQSPAYRDDKAGTALDMLPGLLSGHQGARLAVRVDGRPLPGGPQAVLVSNNPYETGDIAGLGRRARLDTGLLGVVSVHVQTAAQAARLLAGTRSGRLAALTGREVIVDADQPEIPVGIDGEAVMLPVPVRCVIRPLGLRVRVPARRPGVPPAAPPLDWARLRHAAGLARLRHDPTGQPLA
jgi:diacylglycerol kinase family enzyme